MRAGGTTLILLGSSRVLSILRSLAEGAKGRLELRRETGLPAQSTLRSQLDNLEAAGLVLKRRPSSSSGTLEYELADPGRELLVVAESLERWLAEAPDGALELGGDPAKAAIRGLVESWNTTVLTQLAGDPHTLTELDKRITLASYPTIERCLETMRLAQQLNLGTRGSRGTPCALTDWVRRGLAPLTHAARWEHRHEPDDAAPVSNPDVHGALMLVAPLLELPAALSGVCQVAAKLPTQGEKPKRFLTTLRIENAELAFGPTYPDGKPDAWASATAETWFSTMIDGETHGLRLSGDRDLALTVLDGLHRALFAGDLEASGKTADD